MQVGQDQSEPDGGEPGGKFHGLNYDGICRCHYCRSRTMQTVLELGLGRRNQRLADRVKRLNTSATGEDVAAAIHNRVLSEMLAFRQN